MTLADVAGSRVRLVGAAALPLYGSGAVVTHGAARWMFLVLVVVAALETIFNRRSQSSFESVGAVFVPVVIIVMFGWLVPDLAALTAASLAPMTLFTGLMSPRPFADVGIAAIPAAYAASQFVFVSGAHVLAMALGVAVANFGLGAALLFLRGVTERTVSAHTQALAAVNSRLEQLNRTDSLTGLINRRGFDEVMASAWTHAKDSREPVAVIMIDVDYFKKYNDRYGHVNGDDCLRTVASALAGAIRGTDQVARYGGEEFSIVLPGTDLATAYQAAERVRLSVACQQIEHADSPAGLVGISLGVASVVPGEGDTPEQLVQQADNGLYEAKRNGRNRVGVAPLLEGTQDRDTPDPIAVLSGDLSDRGGP